MIDERNDKALRRRRDEREKKVSKGPRWLCCLRTMTKTNVHPNINAREHQNLHTSIDNDHEQKFACPSASTFSPE